MSDGRGLYVLYKQAGANFLAYRLTKLFNRIETPEDQALHNDVLAEVMQIIEGKEQEFFKQWAADIFMDIHYVRVNRRKRWLWRVASRILNIGQSKGQRT